MAPGAGNNNAKKKKRAANNRDIRNIECTVEGSTGTKRTSRTVNDKAKGQDVYNVAAILDERQQRSVVSGVFEDHWKIRWDGYGQEEDTWEPACNLAGLESDIAKFRKVSS